MKRQAEWDSRALRALATSLPGLRTVGSGICLGLPGDASDPCAPEPKQRGATTVPGRCRVCHTRKASRLLSHMQIHARSRPPPGARPAGGCGVQCRLPRRPGGGVPEHPNSGVLGTPAQPPAWLGSGPLLGKILVNGERVSTATSQPPSSTRTRWLRGWLPDRTS